MTDQPHVTIEFVGGPFCGAVVDSREQPIRSSVLRGLLSAAWSDHPAELRLRQLCLQRAKVKVGQDRGVADADREQLHRYRLLVELGFESRVLFRAEYAGVEVV